LTPGWNFTQNNPPLLELVNGKTIDWQDTVSAIQQAKVNDLQVAIRPVAQFPTKVGSWWKSAPRDFSWWVSWFDRYRAFAIHHAKLAEQNNVPTLILGGDWMAPAMPGSIFSDGSPTGIPLDANERYEELIVEIREAFSGTLGWAVRYPNDFGNRPDFLNEVDLLYVLWSVPLSDQTDASVAEIQAKAEQILSTELQSAWLEWELQSKDNKIIISLGYPSVDSATTGCLPDPIEECIRPENLDFPVPDYPLLTLNLGVQANIYQSLLAAIDSQAWINGVVTSGYYPPTELHDISTSIHGKPAADVLQTWFAQFLDPAN